MFRITRTKHQGNRLSSRHIPQLCKRFLPALGCQLSFIAASKLSKFLGIMAEPFAQLVTRRNLLQPQINPRTLLGKSTWPKPVYQHTSAIVWFWIVIDTLQ